MGYFYKSIDMFRFFYGSLRPLDCKAMNIIILHLWDFYTSGMQDAEVNKVTAYFLYGQWNVRNESTGFIACGCRFSRSYTVYSWLSKGWLLGIWAYQTINAMISLSDHQTIAYYCSIPNAQSNPYWNSCTCKECMYKVLTVYMQQTKCQNIMFLKLFRNSQAEK